MTLNKLNLAAASFESSGSLASLNASVGDAFDLSNYQSVSVQLSGTWVGTVSFEVSNDGTTFVAKNLVSSTNSSVASTTGAGVFSGDIGAKYFRVRRSAFTSGTALVNLIYSSASQFNPTASQAVSGTVTANLGTGGVAATSLGKAEDAVAASGDTGIFNLGVRRDAPLTSTSATGDYSEMAVNRHGALYTTTIDSAKRTYSLAAKITPFAGEILEIAGSASATVEINRITITLYGTAAGKMDVVVNKRSTASTGGTSTTPAKVPYDAADAASTATVKVFSVTPTVGTIVGAVRQAMVACAANDTSDRLKIESGGYAKSFTLSGTAQVITVDLAGTVPTGGEMAIDIEWTEY